jgi:hypothetical protein
MEVSQLQDVIVEAITLCKKGANRQRIFLRKSAEVAEAELMALPSSHRLLKSEDWSVFYCVVAEPGAEEDRGVIMKDGVLQPDPVEGIDVWASEDEIRKAAHRFAKNKDFVTRLHESMTPYGEVVENAVALTDIEVNGEVIKKGSWYIGVEPNEEGKRKVEAGELESVSVEGTGIRTPVAKKALSSGERKTMNASFFVFPAEKRYPIHDRAHGANALSRASGKPEEAKVRAAVCKRYPDLPACKTKMKKSFVDRLRDWIDGQEEEPEHEAIGKESATLEEMADGENTERIEALEGKVDSFIEKFDPLAARLTKALDKAEEKEAPTVEDLKKALDTLLGDVDGLKKGVDALAEGDSTQPADPETLRKQNADDKYHSAILG